jgi:amino acid permease
MSYHPLYGILFFFICLFVAYIFGKKSFSKKNQINIKKENRKYTRELISPDAPWLDKNENRE